MRCSASSAPGTTSARSRSAATRATSHASTARRSRRHSIARCSCTTMRAYLVTGGLGGLGLAAARRLVERGARTLVLRQPARRRRATRAPRSPRSSTRRDRDRRARGCRGSRGARGGRERHRVRGVIHAAGVMTPAMIAAIDPDDARATLAAKVDGARHLHELTAAQPLDFFVLYSSIATLLGMPGQAAYAAANAYLDALAQYRRANGLPATSIAWTVIEGTGMAAHAGAKAIGQLADRGVATLAIDRATDVLERALHADLPAHARRGRFDLARWTAFYPHAATIARLRPLATEAHASPARSLAAPRRDRARDRERAARGSGSRRRGRSLPVRGARRPCCTTRARSIRTARSTDLGDGFAHRARAPVDGEDRARARACRANACSADVSIRELAADLAAQLGGAAPAADTPARRSAGATRRSSIPTLDVHAPRSDRSRARSCSPARPAFSARSCSPSCSSTAPRDIHCLVRARARATAMRRLEATLGRYDLAALDLARTRDVHPRRSRAAAARARRPMRSSGSPARSTRSSTAARR